MTEDADGGGRVFFARSRRAPDRDAEIRLVSVGVDIGSSTSHLAFSRIVLQRSGQRSRVLRRELLHESDILLTPYGADETIDTEALGRFIGWQYEKAEIEPEMIDTGALILTGVAAGRRNARAIGALFADETGRFVAVTAGDALETTLAAQGSGAVGASRGGCVVMNVDIGGGTSKIAICEAGAVTDLTAVDVGARLICTDTEGRVVRIEPSGRTLAAAAGVEIAIGRAPVEGGLARIAALMAERLFEACRGAPASPGMEALMRLPPLRGWVVPDELSFSGGVAEYLTGRESRRFGDMGALLAEAVEARFRGWGPRLRFADQAIRATVIGASQHSVQLSGNTIFVEPTTMLPLRSLAVIVPGAIGTDAIDADAVAASMRAALRRMGLEESATPVAIGYRWDGVASHPRIAAFCRGIGAGCAALLGRGLPLVLVGEGDVGGLIGLACRKMLQPAGGVVSIDGIAMREFDFIDIGEILEVSGGVPVVVKSLVFPASQDLSAR